MPPLEIEAYHKGREVWVKSAEVKPGDPPGSISDNKPNGKRDIYMFECITDDSKSTIYRSVLGLDLESAKGERTVFFDPSKREVVKELAKGESHEITVFTDKARQASLLRFTHK